VTSGAAVRLPKRASSSPAAHSSKTSSPSFSAASGYARSSISTSWTSAAVPGGADPLAVAAGGRGATSRPARRGRGGGGAGSCPIQCAATASRSARPCARTSRDWAGHSHTQCARWPQNEQAPRRRGGGADSGAPPPPTPHGGGGPPQGSLRGRLKCGNTVPTRGGTGVPGARVPRPRATPVQMGSNSRLPPHAGCCCHSDACGVLSTGSTGVSPGDPYSGAATDATSTAAHSARSASVPESVT